MFYGVVLLVGSVVAAAVVIALGDLAAAAYRWAVRFIARARCRATCSAGGRHRRPRRLLVCAR